MRVPHRTHLFVPSACAFCLCLLPMPSAHAFRPCPNAPFQYVTNDDINVAIHTAIPHNLDSAKVYTPDTIGSHSLHAGGTMALFHQGFDATAIMKLGQWTSTALMIYLHEQLDIISHDATHPIPTTFINVAIDPPPEDKAHTQHHHDTNGSVLLA